MNRRVAPALLTSWLLLVTLTLAAQRSGQSAIIRHTKDGYSTKVGTPLTGMHELQVAQRFITSERAFNAFFMSEFDFWDARILADYWDLSIRNSKLNIGRKLIRNQQNGTLDLAINSLNSQVRRARSSICAACVMAIHPPTRSIWSTTPTTTPDVLPNSGTTATHHRDKLPKPNTPSIEAWPLAITTSSKHP